LIESALAFALGVERNRQDARRRVKRRTLLRGEQQMRQTPGHVRLMLQSQHRRAQRSLVFSD
jgi:hypothetical protein